MWRISYRVKRLLVDSTAGISRWIILRGILIFQAVLLHIFIPFRQNENCTQMQVFPSKLAPTTAFCARLEYFCSGRQCKSNSCSCEMCLVSSYIAIKWLENVMSNNLPDRNQNICLWMIAVSVQCVWYAEHYSSCIAESFFGLVNDKLYSSIAVN
jgi:hypothetical protein